MRTAASAIAWEFRQRHRWGFLMLAAYFAYLAVVRLKIDSGEAFAIVIAVPLTTAVLFLLGVFTYGLSGDIAAQKSMYPARTFTLPLTNSALAGWPMAYGTTVMTLWWFATRALAAWPDGGANVPFVWPGLLAAAMVAWSQALTWMPYPLRNMRVVMTVLWLISIDAIVMIALEFKPSELVMIALLAPHVPLAYLTARFAVDKARHGGVEDSRTRLSGQPRRLSSTFSSPSRAQLWLEWKQHGRTLPLLVAILLPFELSMLFVFRETPVIIFETLSMVLFTPPFMAAFVAATSADEARAFVATRPVTDTALIAAKLRSSLLSALASWGLIAIALPVALKWSGTSATVGEWGGTLVEVMGIPRAIVLSLTILFAYVLSTWTQLVQSLFVVLSGRASLKKASVFVALGVLTFVAPALYWLGHNREVRVLVWNGFPWIAAALVAIRIALMIPIAHRISHVMASVWSASVLALYAILCWIFPQILIRHYVLALIAILTIPIVRITAAPLAMTRSRHA